MTRKEPRLHTTPEALAQAVVRTRPHLGPEQIKVFANEPAARHKARDLARTFPQRLQELIGYDLGAVNLGFVDHKHPNEVLNGTAGDGPGDLGPEALQRREERTNKLRVASWAPMNRKRVRLDADVVQGSG